ncbi:hypothetical protein KN10_1833 [Anoxybacillus flavithermus NBRC 109594]|uniref:Uncharacterized protein n=1 Tax=Anoxybacillus flavithermus NBRC 109594 TaxID=1315967 RepID=R4G6R6_9BACL|nr:hypothetical protein [Anoxybacillus flavithermus]GAC91397.1 hypothetical protein KN10_1833 [Anoxybacillus flavithermus NBRC 109594]
MNDWNMYDPFRADQQLPQQTQQMPQMMPGDCGCGMPMGPMWPMGQMVPQQMQPMPMPQMMPQQMQPMPMPQMMPQQMQPMPMPQMMPQQMQPMPMPQMMPDGCGAPMWPPMPMPYGPQR